MRHHEASHSVSNKMERNTCGHEFQSCQSCSLKVRPRLEGNDLKFPALLERFVDRAERCAIPIGRKSAGIADGHDGISVLKQFGTILRQGEIAVLVVPVSYTHLRAHETRHDLVCRLL